MSLGDLQGLRVSAADALFLDFDGTLAELGPDPDAVFLTEAAAAAVAALAETLAGAVALISGRDVRDLSKRSTDAAWRAGGHGLEILAPGEAAAPSPPPPEDAVLAPLRAVEAAHEGVRVELKGPVAALHYRHAPEAREACLEAARKAAAAAAEHVWQAGKMVVEVKPARAHKGTALRAMMERPPFHGRRPLMLGDDATDEDAIRVAQELGGLGVKIGEGDTAARLRAPDPEAVRAWLAREAGRS